MQKNQKKKKKHTQKTSEKNKIQLVEGNERRNRRVNNKRGE
jgi:hypothetical protein